MRDQDLRDVIATDIPRPIERAPLELDEDITRRDAWMFAPLIAAGIAVPLIAAALFAFSTWNVIHNGPSLSATQPTTFASRWPGKSLPLVVLR